MIQLTVQYKHLYNAYWNTTLKVFVPCIGILEIIPFRLHRSTT